MSRKALWAVFAVACLWTPLMAQGQGDYLDVYIVKAKPEKSADLDALARKMVDANRRFNGDRWLATETVYGEGGMIAFVSTRESYADTDKGSEAFMSALQKAYGKDGADKMLRDWNNCLASSRSELRKRRWDLSWKVPQPGSYAKFIGDSRVLRTTAVHVRPVHITDFEELLKEVKSAEEANPNALTGLISQVMEGGKGTTFYVTGLRTGMDGFDKNPTLHEILGEEGYKKFLQISADSIDSTESSLLRFSPDLSNPPQDILAAAPAFWQPKATVAASKAKTKAPVEADAKKSNE